jgi:aminoglycoside phosphotransferase
MRIIQKNACIGVFLAVIGLGNFNAIAQELTKPKSTAELEREAESMEWLVKKLPYPVSIVESDEDKEIASITNQARALFKAKDFEKLDAL